MNTQATKKTTTETNRKEKPTLHGDWHKPLDIPITEWLVAVFTLVIMGSSIVYTMYAKRQWKVMRESNAINRESLESVQRAFITFKEVQAELVPEEKATMNKWGFAAKFENSGTTPGYMVAEYFSVGQLLKPPAEERFLNVHPHQYSVAVGPKTTYDLGRIYKPYSFLFEDVEHKGQRTTPPHFWGWVVYRDVFHQTKLHLTEFCAQVASVTSLSNKPFTPKTIPYAMTLTIYSCQQHNCSDESCNDYNQIIAMVPK